METGHKNLEDVFDNSARYSTMSKGWKGKKVECVSKWCYFFYAKHTDPHIVRSRSTLKVGKLMSVHFETGRSANSIAKESNDLVKVSPENT